MGPDPEAAQANSMLTYKRRRNSKASENGKVSDDPISHPSEKNGSHAPKAFFDGCSLKHQRNIILDHISKSLDGEGGLKNCIKNALVFNPGNGSETSVKGAVYSCEDWRKCNSQTETCGPEKAVEDNLGMTPNGSVNEFKQSTFTELCERTFSDIIMSEKFTQLCCLILENFQGFKADKIFNLKHINSRMTESTYESSPLLFQSDMQETWTKLQKVGSDITALAKCLSDETASSFFEQVDNSALCIPDDSKYEFPTQESDLHAKPEKTEVQTPTGAHTCKYCWKKADEKNSLVCDSCEGMFHISCIDPPIIEIPTSSWYCANCTSSEIESSHEDCVVCERLINESKKEDKSDKNTEKVKESSSEGSEKVDTSYCKVCGTEVNDGDYRICGHSFCSNKYYHVRCLSGEQLTCYGPCWYCPSCLCRGCLADRDDDKIVLCDGCDDAYHIYCMHPPRDEIPEGKWFCEECESGMMCIREAKRMYEIGMQQSEEGLDKSV